MQLTFRAGVRPAEAKSRLVSRALWFAFFCLAVVAAIGWKSGTDGGFSLAIVTLSTATVVLMFEQRVTVARENYIAACVKQKMAGKSDEDEAPPLQIWGDWIQATKTGLLFALLMMLMRGIAGRSSMTVITITACQLQAAVNVGNALYLARGNKKLLNALERSRLKGAR